ncbi:UNVERIFIED_CONTAM: Glycerophosphodiester phosphodiesterase GDPDL3 [Sesamum latifolium]|uniref:glycerophosphodiester phosphodiesterase n=1 Tax=Sesamum latifolium TaxID=2727402 RepID=A0AAW2WPK7_9LAMI
MPYFGFIAAAISNPYSFNSLFRNPAAQNVGKLMQLSDFLAFANNASSISGILISIENAAYLAEKQGLGVTDAVLDALSKAGYNNQTAKKIMIKSSDSAVLSRFKSTSNYELVYLIDEDISDILNTTILEIRKFASSVVILKESVFPTEDSFITGETSIVPKMQAFDLPVYVQLFQNEYASQPYDFFSDAYVEINAYYAAGIDGVITDYPAAAAKFKKAPSPILMDDDVAEPPLPPVTERPPRVNTGSGSTAPEEHGQTPDDCQYQCNAVCRTVDTGNAVAPKYQPHPRKTSPLLHEHKNFVCHCRTRNSADRPDPVEIMMIVEEKFGVSVGESGAETSPPFRGRRI